MSYSFEPDELAHRESSWHRQVTLFLVAMGFFTRIPMPRWVKVDGDKLNKSSRYFGAIGILIGAISALVYWLSAMVLPNEVAVLLAMVASMFATGGFHEDGLADTADGLGGGWTVADKLRIMKDSRLGSYGALALVMALLLKWQLLISVASAPSLENMLSVPLALVLAHTLSRVLAASIIYSQPYVREDDSSKSKPVAQNLSLNELFILLLTGLLVLLFVPFSLALSLIASMCIVHFLCCRFFQRQLGGIVGDALGAAQQVSELVCYGVIVSVGVGL